MKGILLMKQIGSLPFSSQEFQVSSALALNQVINVASVTQLSPFRYPGGKTWLVPRVIKWLKSRPRITEFVEPFVGGGIVSLTVADQDLADHLILVEKDEQVVAVWKTIFEGETEWLVNEILNFEISYENVVRRLQNRATSQKELAFQTILKNRTFHGGILAPGSAPLKHGENGKGIRSRWYPETLVKRIRRITAFASKVTVVHGDGIDVITEFSQHKNAAFFIDPPYSAAGKRAGRRLYTHFELDHHRLFEVASRSKGDFLMTYDDNAEIRGLAGKFNFECKLVAMKNTHHAEMKELLIGRELSWVH